MRRQSAFTLFEMLVALAIIAILASTAIPGWQHFLSRKQEQLLQQQLERVLSFAHEEAMISVSPVLVLISENTATVSSLHHAVLRRETLHLNTGRLQIRSYPHYRNDIRFMQDGMADNASIFYYRRGEKYPAWTMTLSREGLVSSSLSLRACCAGSQ